MYGTIIFALFFWLQTPAAPRGTPETQNPKTTYKAADRQNSSPRVAPVIPTASPSRQPQMASKQDGHQQQSNMQVYRVSIVQQPLDYLMLAYVVITGIAAYVALRTLSKIREQTKLMTCQLTEMQEARKQTDLLIKQATDQARAGLSAAQTAEGHYQIIRNSERPWILIERIKLSTFEQNEELIAYVTIKNYGRSPAFLAEHKIIFRLMQAVPKPPLQYSPFPFEFQQEIMIPHAVGKVGVPLHEGRLTRAQVEAVRNRKEFLFVFGFIKYRDGAGSAEYRTDFFHVYDLPVIEGYEFMPTGPIEYNQVK